jgi:hypothetical protein
LLEGAMLRMVSLNISAFDYSKQKFIYAPLIRHDHKSLLRSRLKLFRVANRVYPVQKSIWRVVRHRDRSNELDRPF